MKKFEELERFQQEVAQTSSSTDNNEPNISSNIVPDEVLADNSIKRLPFEKFKLNLEK
jgi:hypothetical protein